MNPFGLFHLAMAVLEGVADVVNPKRPRETRRERRRFLLIYFIWMLLGIAVVVWAIRSLYFTQ